MLCSLLCPSDSLTPRDVELLGPPCGVGSPAPSPMPDPAELARMQADVQVQMWVSFSLLQLICTELTEFMRAITLSLLYHQQRTPHWLLRMKFPPLQRGRPKPMHCLTPACPSCGGLEWAPGWDQLHPKDPFCEVSEYPSLNWFCQGLLPGVFYFLQPSVLGFSDTSACSEICM